MKLIKLFWSLDKTYTIILFITVVFMIFSIARKDMDFYTFNLIYMYMAFNEIRYKYDKKNNFKN